MCTVYKHCSSSVEGTRIAGFAECEGLDTFGRFSFNGFNKDIEVSCIRDLKSSNIVSPSLF